MAQVDPAQVDPASLILAQMILALAIGTAVVLTQAGDLRQIVKARIARPRRGLFR